MCKNFKKDLKTIKRVKTGIYINIKKQIVKLEQ